MTSSADSSDGRIFQAIGEEKATERSECEKNLYRTWAFQGGTRRTIDCLEIEATD